MAHDQGCGRPRRRRLRPRAAAVVALWVLAAACGAGGDPPAASDAGGAGSGQPAATGPATAPADGATGDATEVAAAGADGGATRQVTFAGAGLRLAGDLWLPDATGPHPGVVLVHGSGPQDRDMTVPGQLAMTFPRPVAVFTDVARALRAAGYAVLTYDKRTCGPFNGCADNGYPQPPADLTVDAFVADAAAAVTHLRTHERVDGAAVAVIGHSQGASFVPGLLIDEPGLAAGVMLSAPHDPLDQVLRAQDDAYAQVAELRSEGVPGDTMIQGASADFWRSWLRVTDGVPQLATQVERPLLVLGGALDANVPPAQLAAWRRTLAASDHAEVVELDCVTHALNCVTADDLSSVVPDDVGHEVDARVGETIVEFLDGTLR